jgi:hypothetical protein
MALRGHIQDEAKMRKSEVVNGLGHADSMYVCMY